MCVCVYMSGKYILFIYQQGQPQYTD